MKYLASIIFIITEMGVSGYYTPIDFLWVFPRVMLIIGITILAYNKMDAAIKWSIIVIIPLTALSARSEWGRIAKEKLTKSQKLEETRIKLPIEPTLPDCALLTKWRKEVCDSRSEKLQAAYSLALEKYNAAIQKSENKIKAVSVNLTWSEQQPIFIYILFSCCLSFMTMISLPGHNKKTSKQIITKKRLDEDLKKMSVNKILKEKRKFPRKSFEVLCQENGVAYKSFDRWKKQMSESVLGNVRTSTRKGLEEIQEENENG